MPSDDRFELPHAWRRATFASTDAFGATPLRPHPRGVVVVRLVKQRDEIAAGLWEEGTGKLLRFLPGVGDARWTPDGKHLVTVDEAMVVTMLAWPGLAMRRRARADFDTRHGVGGLDLAISSGGSLAVVTAFSGQSEEGFVLLSLPELETRATLPYVVGESASPCVFSADEQLVAFVVEPRACWWAADTDDADWDTPAAGGLVRWATLYLQETRLHGAVAEHPILVDLPRGWLPEEALAGASWPRNVRFIGGARLEFDLPWGGKLALDVPPRGAVIAPTPSGHTA